MLRLSISSLISVSACIILLYTNIHVSAFHIPKTQRRSNTIMKSSSNNKSVEGPYDIKTRNPLRLLVLKLGLTEPAWTSPLNYQKKQGTYNCAYCGLKLFDSCSKFDSGTGWPSFWRSIEERAISYKMEIDGRLECRCGRCSSHLGHVFLDGPRKTDVAKELVASSPSSDPRSKRDSGRLPRFCINGASLRVDET